jgi:CheY-like chemotaxis protein
VRVLVVEDESDAREVTVMTLEHFGAQVTSVSSSSDALAAIKACAPEALPHVLVSDIGMPRQDGYDLIRKVRSLNTERGGRIKAVCLTGYATPEHVHRALQAGYQAHVSKPVDPSALLSAINNLTRDGGQA